MSRHYRETPIGRGAAAAGLCLLAACQAFGPTPVDAVAEVDGEIVSSDQLEGYLRDNVDGADGAHGLSNVVLSRLFDRFLDELLLLRLAAERSGEPSIAGGRGAVERLLRDELERVWEEADVAAFYEAHREEFQRPERVHLRQILVEDRQAAEEAQAALAEGESFPEVAARLSVEPHAGRGGDQGVLAREDLPSPFQEVIFELAPGAPSDIVAADYGFHIFQVVERYPAEVVPLAEVEGEIRELLARERLDTLTAALVDDGRQQYNVVVFKENLPFEYRGVYVDDADE